jgi:hypothetical protein
MLKRILSVLLLALTFTAFTVPATMVAGCDDDEVELEMDNGDDLEMEGNGEIEVED